MSRSQTYSLEASLLTYATRPLSRNAEWEQPAAEGEPFDYKAKPSRFYFDVETVGNLDPDAIIQQAIKVLQTKFAVVIQDLTGEKEGAGDDYEPQSPGVNGVNGDSYGMDQGYTTPYAANGGGATTWGGAGGATPYGATPYGNSGWN